MRTKSLMAAMYSLLLLGGCGTGDASQISQERVPPVDQPEESVPLVVHGTGTANLRELIVDMVASRGCDYVQDKIMLLSPSGAESTGEGGPVSGVLWLDGCNIIQTDATNIKADVSGIGWQWVERETKTAGGTFQLNQIVGFDMSLSTAGTFDMTYDPNLSLVAVWFVPTQPVEATFTVQGELDVDAKGLWSWIVGKAAGITGRTPEERAEEKVRSEGTQSISSKLSQGFTAVYDLCSGKQYTKFGMVQTERLATIAAPNQEVCATVVLQPGSMMMSGPFRGEYTAEFTAAEGGGFEVLWVCKDEARRVAEQLVETGQVDDIEAVERHAVRRGGSVTLTSPPAANACPLVVVTRPLPDAEPPVSYSCTVFKKNADRNRLLDCQRLAAEQTDPVEEPSQ